MGVHGLALLSERLRPGGVVEVVGEALDNAERLEKRERVVGV